MRRARLITLTSVGGMLLALCGGAPLAAQQQGSQSRDREFATDRENQQSRQSGQQSRQGGQIRVQPRGWIRILADYDQDGQIDAAETIYYLDLEKARESSRERRGDSGSAARDEETARRSQESRRRTQDQQAARQQGQDQQFQRRQGQDQQAQRRQGQDQQDQRRQAGRRGTHQVTGTLTDVQRVTMAGEREAHLVARIRERDGRTARVLLGKESELEVNKLRNADEVTVTGFSGRVNDRPVLVAERIQADGESYRVDNRAERRLKRVKGELLSTRTARFRGHDQSFVIGQVRLQGGDRATVNFGPKSNLEDQIQLREGMQLSLLVRSGTINGEQALLAEQLWAEGKTASLMQPSGQRARGTQREIAGRQQSQREQRGYRGPDQQTQDRQERQSEQRQSEQRQSGQRQSRQFDRDMPFTYEGQERAALGIFVSDTEQGIQVARVIEGSPAEQVGLEVGDQLISIGDVQVDTYRDVVESIQRHDPQEQIRVRVQRDGETQEFRVTLKPREEVYENVDENEQ